MFANNPWKLLREVSPLRYPNWRQYRGKDGSGLYSSAEARQHANNQAAVMKERVPAFYNLPRPAIHSRGRLG